MSRPMQAIHRPVLSGGRPAGPHAAATFQSHHLLPRAILRRPQFAAFFDSLARVQPDRSKRQWNCIWLPAEESLSLALGHALHRGPHPRYSDVVAARVERIRAQWEQAGADAGGVCAAA